MSLTTSPVRTGLFPPFGLLEQGPETARAFLAQAERAGIDHICCGDHVSFFGGSGFDGLLQAAALAALHPTLPVYTGVYLLPLRHPVLVARQLADLGRIAPGRLIFGVGIGGEDRHEVELCGVDPATRGARMNECLAIVRQLLTGKPVTHHGRFFDLDDAAIARIICLSVNIGEPTNSTTEHPRRSTPRTARCPWLGRGRADRAGQLRLGPAAAPWAAGGQGASARVASRSIDA